MSHVTCQVSHVRCQVSGVMNNFFLFFNSLDKVVELVHGLSVINGAYPSSLYVKFLFSGIFHIDVCKVNIYLI